VSVLQGIRDKVGTSAKVVFAEGVRLTESEADWYADAVTPADPALNAKRIDEAVKIARAADVVLLVLGENESTGREAWADNHLGDRDSLEPLGQQNDLVRAISALNKPMVALMLGSRPLAMTYIAETVPAIYQGWYLGQEGGTAFADVLFGDYNPAARLPVTIPRSVGQVPAYYSQKPSARRGYLFADKSPLFPFGHGLSYTTFRYANLRVTPNRIGTGGEVTVSVDVTNTGQRAGEEVVQLYVHDLVSSVTRPIKELKGFERISLAPGETKTVTFTLEPRALSFLNRHMERVVEPGDFEVMVGPSSAVAAQTARFTVASM
jgi:beta-glucosidase